MLVQDLIAFLVACLKNFNENNNNWKEKMHFQALYFYPGNYSFDFVRR